MSRLLHILLLTFAVSTLYAQSEETNRILSYLQKAMNFNKVVRKDLQLEQLEESELVSNKGLYKSEMQSYKKQNQRLLKVKANKVQLPSLKIQNVQIS